MSGPTKTPGPPRLGERVLSSRLPDDPSSRAILGDLREDYLEERASRSRLGADLWYWGQVVSISARFVGRRKRATGLHASGAARLWSLSEGIDGFLVDFRLALRKLARSPGFAALTTLTLTIGIAGTVAIFSVLDAALLRALPFPDAGDLVTARTTFDGRVNATSSYPDYIDFRDQSDVFASLSVIQFGSRSQTLMGDDGPEQIPIDWVTVDLFRTLAVEPQIGRSFTEAEAEPGSEGVVMISHGFWQRFFGGAPDALGKTLVMGGVPRTVVGIMPAAFRFRDDADMWLPIRDGDMDTRGRRSHSWNIIGRLGPGISLDQAQAQVDVVARQMAQAYPDSHEGKGLVLTPLGETLAEAYRPGLLLLMGATGLLLLVACGNVAGLILARATTRRSEISLRAALGAPRGRLVRQLFAESLVTAVMAGFLGSALALWFQRLLLTLMPLDALGVRDIGLSLPMLGFAVAVSVGTAVIFGVGPALTTSQASPIDNLRSGTRHSSGSGAGGLRAGMVVVQVALTVMMLSGSGLLLRSVLALGSVDVGFDTEKLLAAGVSLPQDQYQDSHTRLRFFQGLADDVASLPGVTSASFINMVPFRHRFMNWKVWDPENPPPADQEGPFAYSRTVLPGFFETMGIPLLRGRDHDYADTETAQRFIVISESLAEELFAGVNAVGRQIEVYNAVTDPLLFEVIGVVGDIRMTALERDPYPQMYFAYLQWPNMSMNLMVRRDSDRALMVGGLRDIIRERERDALMTYAVTMDEIVAESWWANRVLSYAVTLFTALAVLLAASGVYGILAFQVARRTHEIGIRVALGASTTHVMRSVLRTGLLLVGAGLTLGLPGALATTRFLQWQLYGVEPTDPLTYGVVALCFLTIGAVACFVPARRALRINPVRALQAE